MNNTHQSLLKLRNAILSMKAEALALKSQCHEDERTIIANCQGRVWVLDKLLVEVGGIIDASQEIIAAK